MVDNGGSVRFEDEGGRDIGEVTERPAREGAGDASPATRRRPAVAEADGTHVESQLGHHGDPASQNIAKGLVAMTAEDARYPGKGNDDVKAVGVSDRGRRSAGRCSNVGRG